MQSARVRPSEAVYNLVVLFPRALLAPLQEEARGVGGAPPQRLRLVREPFEKGDDDGVRRVEQVVAVHPDELHARRDDERGVGGRRATAAAARRRGAAALAPRFNRRALSGGARWHVRVEQRAALPGPGLELEAEASGRNGDGDDAGVRLGEVVLLRRVAQSCDLRGTARQDV